MRFSIVIPTFNRAELLDQAIKSALSQTYVNREVLVVDDGSIDQTATVALNYGTAVRYLRQNNQGKAAALNLGIAASTGDVLLVLDDDDLLPRHAVSRHAEALSRNPGADFSYGRYIRFVGESWPSPSELKDEEFVPSQDPRRLIVKLMEKCFISNPTWAVRRQAQLKVGEYDTRLHRSQDFDMILRLARRNEGIFVDDVVHLQRTHRSVRGPAAEQTFSVHTIDKWLKYDALIFESIDRDWSLSDFRPLPNLTSSASDMRLMLLQKGVILFQRKVYDGAAGVFREYRQELGPISPTHFELKIGSGLLGCRYGVADLVARTSHSRTVSGWLRAGRWPLSMRMAFASQLRWRLRGALASRQFDEIFGLFEFARRAFGLPTTLAILGSRYNSGAELWRTAPESRVNRFELLN
jgi:glycosyltransferase involved in cell wall biosynthesis